jgi:hypothetical protein
VQPVLVAGNIPSSECCRHIGLASNVGQLCVAAG